MFDQVCLCLQYRHLKKIENNHNVYRGKDCIKKFSEPLGAHAMNIINFKRKKKNLLTKQQQESYENAKICYIWKEKLGNKYVKEKKYNTVRNHGHYTGECRGAARSICNLKYSVPEKMAFHNGSDYNYHFIIKCYQNNLKYNLLV